MTQMTNDKTNIRAVYSPHPLLPTAGRTEYKIPLKGQTLYDLLNEFPEKIHRLDVHAFINDRLIPRSEWHTTNIKEGDQVCLKQAVHGGDSKSNPLQIILMIVVLAVAMYTGQYWAVEGVWGTASYVGYAAVMIAGTLLVQALFPVKMPTGDDAPDQTYGISATSNRARPYDPLPLVVGTVRIFPDVGAKPYVEQTAKDAFLNEMFNYGFGNLVIANTKIGDTLMSDYQEVAYQYTDLANSNTQLTLFPANVDSVEGGSLEEEDGWITRTTPSDTNRIGIDLSGSLFRSNDEGGIESLSVEIEIDYKLSSSNTWLPFTGSVDNATGRNRADGRLDRRGGRGEPEIDTDNGIYSSTGIFVITSGTTKPLRWTVNQLVDPAQYDVRMRRLTETFTDTKKTASLTWAQMRCFQPDDSDYLYQNRLAVRIRATGQLNGTIKSLNSIVSAKIPVWTGSSWVTQVSSNPAWIFLYIARGQKDANGKRLWGGGLSDSRIDIEGIKEWGAWCDAHGLGCNFVFQSKVTLAEMLTVVSRCGRGTFTFSKGTLGAVYDQEDLPITQVFGMGNIIADTFGVSYITKNLADEIVVKFVNEDLDYQQDEVRVTVPGITNPENPAEIELIGCTTVEQATKEANLMAARQYYHRRRVNFDTDIEGMMCSRGDVITLSHDLTSWGESGRLVSGSNTVLTLDRDITFNSANNTYLGLRSPNGTYTITQTVNPYTGNTVNTNIVTLTSALDVAPDDDPDNYPRDYIFAFDYKETPAKKLKVISITPNGENRATISAIDEEDAYYESESDLTTYVPPVLINTAVANVANIAITEEFQGFDQPLRLYINWELTQATGVRLQARQNRGDWTDYGEVEGTSFDLDLVSWANGDQLDLEITPRELIQTKQSNSPAKLTYYLVGLQDIADTIVLPTIHGLELFGQGNSNEFGGRDAVFVWRKTRSVAQEIGSELLGSDTGTLDAYFQDYEIQILNEDGTLRRVEHTTSESYTYTFEKNREDGSGTPSRTFRCTVKYRSKTNRVGAPATMLVTNPEPGLPTGIVVKSILDNLYVKIDRPDDIDYSGMIVHVGASSGFTPNSATEVYRGISTVATIDTSLVYGTDYYVKIGVYDQFSPAVTQWSTANTVTPEKLSDTDVQTELNIRLGLINTNDWSANVASPMGGWTLASGTLGLTTIDVAATGQFSTPTPVMSIVGNSTAPGWYSRWHHSFDCAGDRAYVSYVWVKRKSVNTTTGLYLGWTATSGKIKTLAGAESTNPYFVSNQGSALTVDKWYLAVGVLQSSGASVSTDLSGIYDPDSGDRIVSGSDFKHYDDSIISQYLRFGFNSSSTAYTSSDGFKFSSPSVYLMDGGEPSIEGILRRSYQQGQLALLDEITANNFASGITPVEIVATLPNTGNFAGRTVFLNTNNILYRHVGFPSDSSGFSAAVANTDITGQIIGTQISDGSISTPKLVANSVTTSILAANSVTANELAVNSVIAGKIAAGAVVANTLAANSVTSNAIAANSVTASKIFTSNLSAIQADMGEITAGTIALDSTGYIRSGQSAYNSGNGFWLGKDGATTKLSIGNTAANNITWNGLTLTMNGASMNISDSTNKRLIGRHSLYTDWFGPVGATVNDINAKFYIRNDGNAYFGGGIKLGFKPIAWGSFRVSGGACITNYVHNCSSTITYHGVGLYAINFSETLASPAFYVHPCCSTYGYTATIPVASTMGNAIAYYKNTSGFRIAARRLDTQALFDPAEVEFVVYSQYEMSTDLSM